MGIRIIGRQIHRLIILNHGPLVFPALKINITHVIMGFRQFFPEVLVLRIHVSTFGEHFIGLGFQFLGSLLALFLGHLLFSRLILLGRQFIFQILHAFLIISILIS